jgi:hypothetical protein
VVVELTGLIKIICIVTAIASAVSALFVAFMNCHFITTTDQSNFKAEIARKLDSICKELRLLRTHDITVLKERAQRDEVIAKFMGSVERYMKDHCGKGDIYGDVQSEFDDEVADV